MQLPTARLPSADLPLHRHPAPAGVPTLLRPVGREVVQQLMAALAAARPHASGAVGKDLRGWMPASSCTAGCLGVFGLRAPVHALQGDVPLSVGLSHLLSAYPPSQPSHYQPADHILRVAEAVAGNLQAEISAGDRLRELLQPRRWEGRTQPLRAALPSARRMLQPDVAAKSTHGCTPPSQLITFLSIFLPRRHGDGGAFRCDPHSKPLPCLNHSSICFPSACCSGGMGVDELSDAIRAAERYPSLAAEVEAARGLRERWRKRAEAQVGACLGTLVRTG